MKKDKEVKISPVQAILRGITAACLITLALFLISAGVMTAVGGINDRTVNLLVYITSLVSVLAGSVITAGALSEKGLINGVLVSVIYVVIMLIVGYIVTPVFSLGLKTLFTLLAAVAGGAVGGVLGVNLNMRR